jgi:NNP family nitrate/nitrite transporter-like MFS transporter
VKNGDQQVWAQNAAFIWVPWIAIAALAAWFGMNDIADAKAVRRAGRHLPAQAQLADVLAVPGHLRLVHRLCRRFPLLIKSQFPGVNPLAYAWLGPLVGA